MTWTVTPSSEAIKNVSPSYMASALAYSTGLTRRKAVSLRALRSPLVPASPQPESWCLACTSSWQRVQRYCQSGRHSFSMIVRFLSQ